MIKRIEELETAFDGYSPSMSDDRIRHSRLERMERLLDKLDHPERCYRTYHTAGSKGKGSTSAYLSALLTGSGKVCGLYTSPHLFTIRERFTLSGKLFPDDFYINVFNKLESETKDFRLPPELGAEKPTVFEMYTAYGYMLFKEYGCTDAVIETGIGGRLDATNTISPEAVFLTPIELEHTEIYKDLEDTIRTFEKFANKARKVIANGDDENIRKINFNNEVIFYGEDESNDYIIKNIKLETTGSSFDLYKKDEFIDNFSVPLYGHHMVMNTVGAIICALDEGVSKEKIKELLPSFKNADRRFAETIIGNTIIVDDYAHHPTEIKVTLEAIRQKYPDKKLTVVFRPNTYSRTSHFKNEFAEALSIADKVYLTPIKCDRENPKDYPLIKSEDIIELIPGSELVDDDTVNKVVKDKDGVVAFMGCATVSHLIENFTKALENIE